MSPRVEGTAAASDSSAREGTGNPFERAASEEVERTVVPESSHAEASEVGAREAMYKRVLEEDRAKENSSLRVTRGERRRRVPRRSARSPAGLQEVTLAETWRLVGNVDGMEQE